MFTQISAGDSNLILHPSPITWWESRLDCFTACFVSVCLQLSFLYALAYLCFTKCSLRIWDKYWIFAIIWIRQMDPGVQGEWLNLSSWYSCSYYTLFLGKERFLRTEEWRNVVQGDDVHLLHLIRAQNLKDWGIKGTSFKYIKWWLV